MVVVVNVGRDGGVVVGPLLMSDNTITVAVAERGEELNEDLFVSHLSADDLGVLAAVVDDAQVGGGDGTFNIGIELSEALVDDFLSVFIGGAIDSVKDLVVLEEASLSVDSMLVRVEVCVLWLNNRAICLGNLFVLIYLVFLHSKATPSTYASCRNQSKDGEHQARDTNECQGATQV